MQDKIILMYKIYKIDLRLVHILTNNQADQLILSKVDTVY